MLELSEHTEFVGRHGKSSEDCRKSLEAVEDKRKHWKVWENIGSFGMCGW